jgi:hypothetical protein
LEKDSIEWNKAVTKLATLYLDIRPCLRCGNPVIFGYPCEFCLDNYPLKPGDKYEDEGES